MQKLILSLFTFWLGVSGTLSTPLMMFGAGFKLTAVAQAEAPAQDPNCTSLDQKANSQLSTAGKDILNFSKTFETAENQSRTRIVDAIDVRYLAVPRPGGLGPSGSALRAQYNAADTTNHLLASRQDVSNLGISAQKAMAQAFATVQTLAKCSQYGDRKNTYNRYVTQFNTLTEKTFPTNVQQYKSLLTSMVDKTVRGRFLNIGIGIDLNVQQEILDPIGKAVDEQYQQNGKLQIERLTPLPDDPSKIQTSDKPLQDTGGKTEFETQNPDYSNSATPKADGCEWAENYKTGMGTGIDLLVRPLAGLGCFAIQSLMDLLRKLGPPADCLIFEIAIACEQTERQAAPALDTPLADPSEADTSNITIPDSNQTEGSINLESTPAAPGTSPVPTTEDQFSIPSSR